MPSTQFPLIAREGWIFITVAILFCVTALRLGDFTLIAIAFTLLIFFILLFRDPRRRIPSKPLAVVAPVDGIVTSVEPTDKGCLDREAIKIVIRVNPFGAYTARSPSEGKVLNLQDNAAAGSRMSGMGGLWIRTDEQDDIVFVMKSSRLMPSPRSFIGYGERLGQGQRCAYIRLAYEAHVYVPLNSKIKIKKGSWVHAGSDVLAQLVHK